ncbi:MAG TPA: TIGR03013 family XrtA/PEP-CTERM system glycosyltransferase [Candidatus Acidoferrales bacterium]|nr:TIGR03013 family XrtA/PEP-CTERM system glycosyltransferase [Candidatus Acidoferrales bacterium]
MRIFNRYYTTYDLVLLLGDVALALLSTALLRLFVHLTGLSVHWDWTLALTQGAAIAAVVILSFYYADLYAIDQTLSKRELLLRLANGFGFVCLIVAAATYLFPRLDLQDIYLLEMIVVGLGLFSWRLGFMKVLKRAMIWSRVLIVGTHRIGKMVAEELVRQKHLGMQVVGFVGAQRGQISLSVGNPIRVSLPIFPKQELLSVVERSGVNRILVAGASSIEDFPALEPVWLRLRGIPIEDCHTFYERLMSKIAITDLHPGWIALSSGFRRSPWILFTKRLIDIAVSAVGLVCSAPLALLAAIAIKLDSPGPVLYRQERVGQHERPFILYKFRSMFADAEAETGPVWAAVDDPRVTRVGKIIRKLRIDEIPQMVNVLKGEMSFVGPRPERPYFVNRLKEKIPYYSLRFSVKPGITGWAQILHEYADSEEDAIEKLQYDLYYIKNISVIFDLQIMLETLKVILFGRGAQ